MTPLDGFVLGGVAAVLLLGGAYFFNRGVPPRKIAGEESPLRNGGDPLAGLSKDAIDRAALDLVYGKVPDCGDSFYGGSLADCDRADRIVADLRAQYAIYEPKRMRDAIIGWLDYYQQKVDASRADHISQKHRRQMDAHDARRAAEYEATAAVHERLRALSPAVRRQP